MNFYVLIDGSSYGRISTQNDPRDQPFQLSCHYWMGNFAPKRRIKLRDVFSLASHRNLRGKAVLGVETNDCSHSDIDKAKAAVRYT